MVTHNPDLATEYSTRIIKVLDGRVTDDSSPYSGEDDVPAENIVSTPAKHPEKKTSMSFFTALALSFNNLMTKKTRTFMTSFAGSIGIIGIALILSVSTGVNAYINQVQEDTLSSYPLTINSESDMVSILANFMGRQAEEISRENEEGYVYSRNVMYDMMSSMSVKESNNLRAFKEYLDSSEDVKKYASLVKYGYASSLSVYAKDPSGKIISGDMNELMTDVYSDLGVESGSASTYSSTFTSMASFSVWQEMLPGENGELISNAVTDQYDVISGDWPKNYDEAVLVLSANNELSDYVLYSLGLKPYEEMVEIMKAAMVGEELDVDEEQYERWSFDDMMDREYRLVHASDKFQHQADGTYVDLTATDTGMSYLFTNDELSTPVKIVGIIRPKEDANAATLTGAIAYTSALTAHIIDYADKNDLVTMQMENKDTDIFTGLPFEPLEPVQLTDAEKAEHIKEYFGSLDTNELADIYVDILCTPSDEYVEGALSQMLATSTREDNQKMIIALVAEKMGVTDTSSVEGYFAAMSDEEFNGFFRENAKEGIITQYRDAAAARFTSLSDDQVIGMFTQTEKSEADYVKYYEAYMPDEYSSSTYEENLKKLGYVDRASPTSISIYVSTFNDKDEISDIIAQYNNSVPEDDQIKYTDYFALMISSVSTVINAISYVLIAFVAISLVVSSIMIGIITYISVLERTKEIGILRAIGASKKDIARVFNAETITVGFVAGVIGIAVTLLLLIPILG